MAERRREKFNKIIRKLGNPKVLSIAGVKYSVENSIQAVTNTLREYFTLWHLPQTLLMHICSFFGGLGSRAIVKCWKRSWKHWAAILRVEVLDDGQDYPGYRSVAEPRIRYVMVELGDVELGQGVMTRIFYRKPDELVGRSKDISKKAQKWHEHSTLEYPDEVWHDAKGEFTLEQVLHDDLCLTSYFKPSVCPWNAKTRDLCQDFIVKLYLLLKTNPSRKTGYTKKEYKVNGKDKLGRDQYNAVESHLVRVDCLIFIAAQNPKSRDSPNWGTEKQHQHILRDWAREVLLPEVIARVPFLEKLLKMHGIPVETVE